MSETMHESTTNPEDCSDVGDLVLAGIRALKPKTRAKLVFNLLQDSKGFVDAVAFLDTRSDKPSQSTDR